MTEKMDRDELIDNLRWEFRNVRSNICSLYANYNPKYYTLDDCTDAQLQDLLNHLNKVEEDLYSVMSYFVNSDTWKLAFKNARRMDD